MFPFVFAAWPCSPFVCSSKPLTGSCLATVRTEKGAKHGVVKSLVSDVRYNQLLLVQTLTISLLQAQ